MKDNNSQSKKSPLNNAERILAILFGIGFILGILLSPLGVEPRMAELRTLAFAGFFIIVGMLIPLAGLILLWLRKPRLAGVLAVIDATLLFLIAPADQALFFFTVSPPPAVTAGEYFLIFVGIGYMLYGPRVYEKRT
ncbi:MAG TPA: hypothetical protein VK444_01065 [Methanobacteriaceae archaeon]|nr:hypothetical protein [Methanobacteriaceae archaeon]